MLIQKSYKEKLQSYTVLDMPFGDSPENSSDEQSSEEIEEVYDDVQAIALLSKSKNPILLACSKKANKNFALKIFHYNGNEMNQYYVNESRFLCLYHPNIVKYYQAVNKQETFQDGRKFYVSSILMELGVCDFFDLMKLTNLYKDQKLVRTYFRQLVEGLDYLHQQGISHLDLKLQNLLLSEEFQLKIMDFDLAHIEGDSKIISKGSEDFRAPEVKLGSSLIDPKKADIFSLGIIFFIFLTGYMPFSENMLYRNHNLYNLAMDNPTTFWELHAEMDQNTQKLSNDVKDLFLSMVHRDPKKRCSIEMIKTNAWCQGPTYSRNELQALMRRKLQTGMNCKS